MQKIYKYSKAFIILVILILMACFASKSFYTLSNLSSILMSASLYGIMACGMMFPLLVSGPDLSMSGMMAVGGMIVVKHIMAHGNTTASFFVGCLLAIIICGAIGAVMGAVIHAFNLPSFIISLAMQYVLYGVAQIGLASKVVCTAPKIFCQLGNGRFLGFPIQIYLFFIIALLAFFLMHRTTYGRKCYMVGGNRKASILCGINVAPVEIVAFMLCAVAAGIAGVILAAMNQQASATAGTLYETDVLLACVLGGASMGEGIGSIGGAIYGAIFVSLLNNCLRMAGVPSLYQTMIVGILIIASMGAESYFKAKASGMHWNKQKNKVVERELG